MDKLYRVKFYFRLFWFLIPIYSRRKESILGISFFVSDYWGVNIPPSKAIDFVYDKKGPLTFIANGGSKRVGLRIRIIQCDAGQK